MSAVSQGSEHLILRLFTTGWVQYGLALTYVPIAALDWAGIWVPLPAFLHFLVLLGFVPIQATILWSRWQRSFWRAFVPLLALVLTLVFGGGTGRHFGNRLIRSRFESNRAAYDTIADQVLRGAYPTELKPEHRHLAYWVRNLSGSGGSATDAVGVSFLVVSHGFAGHVGFIRLSDSSTSGRLVKGPPPGGWEVWLEQLDGPWYLVAN